MSRSVVLLPGDGVGPEVTAAAVHVLEHVNTLFDLKLIFAEYLFGGAAIDDSGHPLRDDTLQACMNADAVFLGAVGGPKWDDASTRPEAGLLALRKHMDVFANLRPTKIYDDLVSFSPLRNVSANTDFLIVRELTGGIYFGEHKEGREIASDICTYTRGEVERIARIAFQAAQKRKNHLVSVDKANVLASSRLWRAVVDDIHEREFPDVHLQHVLVDAMAMKLIQCPDDFDVILTENMFGDILSDEASVLSGSIGLAPSASMGSKACGLFEPIHGSAPDIAGKDMANPVGAIASMALLLRYSLGQEVAALAIEKAIEKVIATGYRTRDLGGDSGCAAMGQHIINAITR